jgi:hypothetical protein
MIRYILLLLFITSISFTQDINSKPCDDKLLIELNIRIESDGIESLTDREWAYYELKFDKCQKYQESQLNNKDTAKAEKELLHEQRRSNQTKEKSLNSIYWMVFAIWIVVAYL